MQDFGYQVIIPRLEQTLAQDKEYVIVDFGDRKEKVRLHDYGRIYEIPGLYEEIFIRRLKYNSPQVISTMLSDVVEESGSSMRDCRVLDFGAGNGVVGKEIRERGCDLIVGIDILPEAKDAANRDRVGVYENYYIMDLSQINRRAVAELRRYHFNTLITVGSLGFRDIPPQAFMNAFNLIEDEGWVAFSIKDRFLKSEDDTGYKATLEAISGDALSIYQTKRYCHRLSLRGERINYIAIIGKKVKSVDASGLLSG